MTSWLLLSTNGAYDHDKQDAVEEVDGTKRCHKPNPELNTKWSTSAAMSKHDGIHVTIVDKTHMSLA